VVNRGTACLTGLYLLILQRRKKYNRIYSSWTDT